MFGNKREPASYSLLMFDWDPSSRSLPGSSGQQSETIGPDDDAAVQGAQQLQEYSLIVRLDFLLGCALLWPICQKRASCLHKYHKTPNKEAPFQHPNYPEYGKL